MSEYSCKDDIINEIFNDEPNKFFIDVGAFNGVHGSHTLTLEKNLGWDGLCIEANPDAYAALKNNRKNTCNAAVFSSDGESVDFICDDVPSQGEMMLVQNLSHAQGGGSGILNRWCNKRKDLMKLRGCKKISLKTRTMSSIMKEHELPKYIQLLDIDIEEADYDALISIDWSSYRFGCILMEQEGSDVENKMIEEGYGIYIQFIESNMDRLYIDTRNKDIMKKALNLTQDKNLWRFEVL